MMMTNLQFGLDDMEALLLEPSSPMADPMGSLLFHHDQEEYKGGRASLEGAASPVSPLNSSSPSSSFSAPSFYSPPHSPLTVLLHEDKAGTESDLHSFPWMGHSGQLRDAKMVSNGNKDDVFSDLDWMAEKMDLSKLDLDSLIGSCGPSDEAPGSPEELLASLDCPMVLDSFPSCDLSSLPSASPITTPDLNLPSARSDPSTISAPEPEVRIDHEEVPSPAPEVPELQEELEIKSEPTSPDVESSCSPADTLDLGSEVDVSASEVKPVVVSVVPQVQRLVFSLSPTRIMLVLAPKDKAGIANVNPVPEVVHSSPPASPPPTSSRSRPYPEPNYKASTPSPSNTVGSLPGASGEEKVTLKAPKNKKLKKMEQNKTAATRYRQKKRAEQEVLSSTHAVLERKNMELKEKAESIAREIKYLKELMEEVQLAMIKKGLGVDP
ncbi:activating transcription factor 4b [Aulostomus maculatus]